MLMNLDDLIYHLLLPFVVLAFFVLGIVAALVGVGLIFWSGGMFRLFAAMNRWVSVSDSLKPLEVPHDIGPIVRRYRAWFGTALILGGAFSVFGLVTQFELPATVKLLHTRLPAAFVAWIANSVRWVLVVGSAAGVVIGAMLVFAPRKFDAVAERMDRWYSPRPVVDRANAMHLGPDRWVQTRPRLAGTLILAGALIVVVSFGILLIRYH